jgi:hypothetical protein
LVAKNRWTIFIDISNYIGIGLKDPSIEGEARSYKRGYRY